MAQRAEARKLKVCAVYGANNVYEYDFDTGRTLLDNVSALCDHFKIDGDPHYWALQRETKRTYMTEDDLHKPGFALENKERLLLKEQGKEAEETRKALNGILQTEERNTNNGVEEREADNATKRHLFELQDHLRVDMFAEEFIALGGVELLIRVIKCVQGNKQALAVKALSTALCYLNGLQYVTETPHVLQELMGLLYEKNFLVVRAVLAVIFVVAQYGQAYALVDRAVAETAASHSHRKYEPLVRLLNTGDLDCTVNTLSVVNMLLKKASEDTDQGGEVRMRRMMKDMAEAGIDLALGKMSTMQHHDFVEQYEIYKEISGGAMNPAQLETLTLRVKVEELTATISQRDAQLAEYRRHQYLVELMRDELFRYRGALQRAHAQGLIVNAHAPTKRHDDNTPSPVAGAVVDDNTLRQLLDLPANGLNEVWAKAYSKSGATAYDLEAKVEKLTERLKNLSQQARNATRELEAKNLEMHAQTALHVATAAKLRAKLLEIKPDLDLNAIGLAETSSLAKEVARLEALIRDSKLVTELMEENKSFQAEREELTSKLASTGSHTGKKGHDIPPPPPDDDLPGPPDLAPLTSLGGEGIPPPPDLGGGLAPPPPPMLGMGIPPPPPPGMDAGMGGIPPPPMLGGPPPPPPLLGGLPPPPGLIPGAPGLMMGPQPRKKPINPKAKMKKLHWKRFILPVDDQDESIWSKLDEIGFDTDAFEAQYCQKVKAAKEAVDPIIEDEEESAPATAVRVLDDKRSNAVAIMMSSLPALSQLKQALLELNAAVLPESKLSELQKHMPNAKEVEKIRAAVPLPDQLDKPEQFLLGLWTVPKLPQRTSCWLFSMTFPEAVRELKTQLTTIDNASKELRSSSVLGSVVQIVLTLGNYMNGGTSNGQADAFDIEFLARLQDTKNVDNTTSLIDFVFDILRKKNQDALKLQDQVPALMATNNIGSLDSVAGEATNLEAKFKSISSQATQVYGSTDPTDQFEAKMSGFFASGLAEITDLMALCKSAQGSFRKVLVYYSAGKQDEKGMKRTSEEVFQLFRDLVTAIVKCFPRDRKTILAARKHAPGLKVVGSQADMSDIVSAIRNGARPTRSVAGKKLPGTIGAPAPEQPKDW